MNVLTLQIKKDSFQSILKGELIMNIDMFTPQMLQDMYILNTMAKDTNGKKIYQMMIRMWM